MTDCEMALVDSMQKKIDELEAENKKLRGSVKTLKLEMRLMFVLIGSYIDKSTKQDIPLIDELIPKISFRF